MSKNKNNADNSIKVVLADKTEVHYKGGYIGLFGAKVEVVIKNNPSEIVPTQFAKNQQTRDGDEHHLTVLFKPEFKSALQDVNTAFAETVKRLKEKNGAYSKKNGDIQLLLDVLKEEVDTNWKSLGIGKAQKQGEEALYQVIDWPSMNEFRKKLKLPAKDFHITLGFKTKDVHDVSKGPETLCWRSE